MRFTISCFLILVCYNISAQGVIITPLQKSSHTFQPFSKNSSKRNIGDTIKLPFFDDFTSTLVYPDQRLWLDSKVYVNHHFPISPPSFGVATFDNLDETGKPYRAMSGLTHGPSDTLTSRYINLKNYQSGLNTVNYAISDSIFISFFVQARGLGDPLDASDSLVLKFLDTGLNWRTVWKLIGNTNTDFNQYIVGVKDGRFLFNGFQFCFINFTKNTGNMNQWHLDYVRMKAGRNYNDLTIRDVAINQTPIGPLKWYESMPYNHFKANPSFNKLEDHRLKLRNNFTTAVNVQYKCEVRNKYNQLIQNYPLSSSARNIAPFSDSVELFTPFNFDTLSSEEPIVRLKYTIAPLANDVTADEYNAIASNNEYTKTVKFSNYFAYDDGSAEGGYGLDYGSLPSGPGYAAIKFQTFAPDTLRGLSVFFNRSVQDVAFKSFSFMVWKTITEPPANNMNNDVLLKKMDVGSTVYTDSINGFVTFEFDTAVYIPQGTFYIGWLQNTPYILNVGYDNNYKYAHQGGRNPNLFFNLNGYWEKVNSNISGAVMMRPIVGKPLPKIVNVSSPISQNTTLIYPNPSGNSQIIKIKSENKLSSFQVFDIYGKVLLNEMNEFETIDVHNLSSGIYTIRIKDEFGKESIHKYIKN
ncbi:MAG: T9SS type A sorting domain-containing protein [Bacteroidota bacterium]|nr:T9SS type A sorting domain-containing protein [Bacteroidota bacterium]